MPVTRRAGLELVVVVIVVAAALKLARPVLVPLVAGLFLAVLSRPIQQMVAHAVPRRMRWVGLLTAMLAVMATLGVFGAAFGLSARAVTDELLARRPRIEAALTKARSAAQRIGLPAAAIPSLPAAEESDGRAGARDEGGDAGGASGAAAPVRVRRLASALVAGVGGLVIALAFCALALAEAGTARRRIRRAVPPDRAPRVLDAVDEMTRAFRRYAWVKTLTSALTGVATTLAALALGLPLPWVWGFLAFLLEYVPSVGSALAVLPPTLMALAIDGPARALVVFFVIGAVQVILGNLVDPRLEGRFMRISPFGVLLSILVWGWLWGPVGALLAVPMTVALVITARHVPGARGLALLVSGDDTDNHANENTNENTDDPRRS